jgi:hypothetical protein
MSRKDASESHHGWSDFIGVGLLAAAVLLLLAQLSFDVGDIAALVNPANKPLHNWIGWLTSSRFYLQLLAWAICSTFWATSGNIRAGV